MVENEKRPTSKVPKEVRAAKIKEARQTPQRNPTTQTTHGNELPNCRALCETALSKDFWFNGSIFTFSYEFAQKSFSTLFVKNFMDSLGLNTRLLHKETNNPLFFSWLTKLQTRAVFRALQRQKSSKTFTHLSDPATSKNLVGHPCQCHPSNCKVNVWTELWSLHQSLSKLHLHREWERVHDKNIYTYHIRHVHWTRKAWSNLDKGRKEIDNQTGIHIVFLIILQDNKNKAAKKEQKIQ